MGNDVHKVVESDKAQVWVEYVAKLLGKGQDVEVAVLYKKVSKSKKRKASVDYVQVLGVPKHLIAGPVVSVWTNKKGTYLRVASWTRKSKKNPEGYTCLKVNGIIQAQITFVDSGRPTCES